MMILTSGSKLFDLGFGVGGELVGLRDDVPGMGEELVGLWDAVPGTGVELVSGFAVIVLIDTTVLVGADKAMLAALVFVFVASPVPTKLLTDLSIASFVVVTMSLKSPQVDLLINDLNLESPSRTPAKLPPVK